MELGDLASGGLLAAMTALTAGAVVAVYRVPALPRPAPAAASTGPDWLTDAFAVAARYGDRLGPLRRPVLGALSWTESHLAAKVRRTRCGPRRSLPWCSASR